MLLLIWLAFFIIIPVSDEMEENNMAVTKKIEIDGKETCLYG